MHYCRVECLIWFYSVCHVNYGMIRNMINNGLNNCLGPLFFISLLEFTEIQGRSCMHSSRHIISVWLGKLDSGSLQHLDSLKHGHRFAAALAIIAA